MMLIDLTGSRYGRLTVIGRDRVADNGQLLWLCRCDCGNHKAVLGASLKSGNTKSCGCATGRFVDEVGNRYGRLVVLSYEHDKRNGALWVCRCDCGNEVVVRGGQLRRGITQSCGCLRLERLKERISLPHGVAAMKHVFDGMRRNARRRNLEWKLTDEQLILLTQKPCHYCGGLPVQIGRGVNGDFVYNGLDRVDSSKGYESENVVPCCITCNNAKRTLSLSEFYAWVRRVYEHARLVDT